MNFLKFDPFPDLKTDRLVLRCLTLDDAPELFYLRSNKEVMKYIDREPQKTVEETEVFINFLLETQNKTDAVLWVIALKENPSVMIGNIGYWRMQKEHYRAEIGYMLHHNFWKKGIMKEAIKPVISYGFETMKLHSIEANINPGNKASEVLLESIGFNREAYFKENYYFNGKFSDSAVYSLLNKKPFSNYSN
ncbi:MAG: GNAT family N-acetyltransferase [Ferruginibacter sp.]